jgi:hypothetical protein
MIKMIANLKNPKSKCEYFIILSSFHECLTIQLSLESSYPALLYFLELIIQQTVI